MFYLGRGAVRSFTAGEGKGECARGEYSEYPASTLVPQYAPTATDQKANKYAPIQLKDLVFTGDGPAQDFMRSAVILLVGLAVVAAILLGIASKSAMGLKKKARAL